MNSRVWTILACVILSLFGGLVYSIYAGEKRSDECLLKGGTLVTIRGSSQLCVKISEYIK